jgi:hypothetical protein
VRRNAPRGAPNTNIGSNSSERNLFAKDSTPTYDGSSCLLTHVDLAREIQATSGDTTEDCHMLMGYSDRGPAA